MREGVRHLPGDVGRLDRAHLLGIDSSNNYSVDIFPADGGIAVYRLQNGKTLKPVPYQNHEAISKEQGAVNELGIVVEGKHVVLTVNGTTITEFNGIPPEGGGFGRAGFRHPIDRFRPYHIDIRRFPGARAAGIVALSGTKTDGEALTGFSIERSCDGFAGSEAFGSGAILL